MTEKSYNPKQKEKKAMEKADLLKKVSPKIDTKVEKKTEEKKLETNEVKKDEKKIGKVKVKKTEAVVNERNAPISTKYSINLCRFIKNKPIHVAIADLEDVLVQKKAVPMKGEYSHQKGTGPGKYPTASTEHFIKLLKSLSANATANDVENPMIVDAIANIAPRPSARFGRWKRKRTHIRLVAKEKTKLKEQKNKVK